MDVKRHDEGVRTGLDGKPYALDFEMRLPLAWNGRFRHQINGGNDGEIVPAIGDPRNLNAYGEKPALARGFAVLSSDEGHNGADPVNAAFGLGAGVAFAADPQARDDYGRSGDMSLGPIGKAIIARGGAAIQDKALSELYCRGNAVAQNKVRLRPLLR